MMKKIEAENILKSFGQEKVLRGVTFSLEEGEILSVLGRSGSGKTTLLKILAGLLDADEGQIRSAGQSIGHLPPPKRGIVYLYQETLLFPHLTVFENMAFGLRIRKVSGAEVKERVGELLNELGLYTHRDKMPSQLSGGQQQRVAFGRAVIIRPALLLLDEPFGNLDAKTREEMQDLFLRVSKKHRTTVLFVTHDLKEALKMGQKIGTMENGSLNIYESRQDFIRDSRSGVSEEMAYWEQLKRENRE